MSSRSPSPLDSALHQHLQLLQGLLGSRQLGQQTLREVEALAVRIAQRAHQLFELGRMLRGAACADTEDATARMQAALIAQDQALLRELPALLDRIRQKPER